MATDRHIDAVTTAANSDLAAELDKEALRGFTFMDQNFAGGEMDRVGAIANPVQSFRGQHLKRFHLEQSC